MMRKLDQHKLLLAVTKFSDVFFMNMYMVRIVDTGENHHWMPELRNRKPKRKCLSLHSGKSDKDPFFLYQTYNTFLMISA